MDILKLHHQVMFLLEVVHVGEAVRIVGLCPFHTVFVVEVKELVGSSGAPEDHPTERVTSWSPGLLVCSSSPPSLHIEDRACVVLCVMLLLHLPPSYSSSGVGKSSLLLRFADNTFSGGSSSQHLTLFLLLLTHLVN